MKRLVFAAALSIGAASSALAADLPPYAPPPRAPAAYIAPPVVPLYSWGGFYIGGNLGAGWNSTGSVSDTFGSSFTTNNSAQFIGGAQVGVNYEFYSGVVIGAEAMFDWLPNTENTTTVTGGGNA